jgi:hypothetical protein
VSLTESPPDPRPPGSGVGPRSREEAPEDPEGPLALTKPASSGKNLEGKEGAGSESVGREEGGSEERKGGWEGLEEGRSGATSANPTNNEAPTRPTNNLNTTTSILIQALEQGRRHFEPDPADMDSRDGNGMGSRRDENGTGSHVYY